MPTFASVEALRASVKSDLGYGDWLVVSRERIRAFADATDDHQWIHLDEQRARGGPYGGTIAHGYLTVSLITRFCEGMLELDGARMAVNYGVKRVRFPAAVRSGVRIRARAEVASADDIEGGVQVALDVVWRAKAAQSPCALRKR